MADLRDDALAAYAARAADWLVKGQERLRPVFTDDKGTLALDPVGKTVEAFADRDAGLLVLQTTDGSDLFFAVHPDDGSAAVRMVTPGDPDGWTRGPVVASLADVGAVLAGEAGKALPRAA